MATIGVVSVSRVAGVWLIFLAMVGVLVGVVSVPVV
jgi:hypothetical protein